MFAKSKSKSTDNAYEEPEDMTPETANTAPRSGNSSGFLLDSNKPSVISEGFSLVGDITAQGVLHVEGMIKGTVTTEAVNIGITGAVEGKIQCTSLQIKGAFVGEARCHELVIASKARVRGTITYETLSIQRGAYVEGELARAT
jgi:cytoskeletal protein CcmA (bactofilin family)